MSNIVLSKVNLPAHLQKSASARASANELAQGVTAGFPLLSYRGKVWRVRRGGEEVAFTNRRGEPVPSVEVVLVRANPNLSKSFYEKSYEEGDNGMPRCWSSDGAKPDSAVKDPISRACATCPNNQWGSRLTESGKKGRLCSDVRRMAVAFADEVKRKGADAHLFLLRVPPASLNPLKDYAEKVLAPAGIDYWVVETRIGFDPQAAHPKLQFNVNLDDDDNPKFLDAATYEAVMQMRESEEAHRILSESEFAGAETTGTREAAARAEPQKELPASAPAARTRMRPVDEEDVPTATVETADDEDDDEAEDEPPPPPPPAPKAKKKAAKPPAPSPVSGPAPSTAKASAPAAKANFDDMLESLLGR